MSNQLRASGFVIYRKVGRCPIEYLLLQASYPPYHWTPPKGHVDPGENDLQTAFRETEEECGLNKNQVNVTSFSKTLHYEAHGKPKASIYWLAEISHPSLPITLSNEHQNFAWLTLDDACIRTGFPDMQQFLRECEKFIKDNTT